jgi:hypothetical protein
MTRYQFIFEMKQKIKWKLRDRVFFFFFPKYQLLTLTDNIKGKKIQPFMIAILIQITITPIFKTILGTNDDDVSKLCNMLTEQQGFQVWRTTLGSHGLLVHDYI